MFGPQTQVPVPPRVSNSNHGNMYVIPDVSTKHPLPWAGSSNARVGEYFCHTVWPDGSPQEACPRELARRQVQRLEERGLKLHSAFEMEFRLLYSSSGEPVWSTNGLFSNTLLSKHEPFLFEVETNLRKARVDIQTIQAEYAPGQCEFTLAPRQGLKAADDFFLTKQCLKEMACQKGMEANFMAEPFVNSAGSGAHFNHSLWSGGENVFYDPSDKKGLSKLARHWIAGLITHACALTALTNHTVNCYRRFKSEFLSSKADWGLDNRRTAIRVKTLSPKETYIENRIPSASCNPYLVLAATIAAGIDGIDHHIPCPERSAHSAEALPSSLIDAMLYLEDDTEIVSALGPEFIQWFIQTKSEVDLKEFEILNQPTSSPAAYAKERAMYSQM